MGKKENALKGVGWGGICVRKQNGHKTREPVGKKKEQNEVGW